MSNVAEIKTLRTKLVELKIKNQLGDLREASEIRKTRRAIAKALTEANRSRRAAK